jgi:hypothetical protein
VRDGIAKNGREYFRPNLKVAAWLMEIKDSLQGSSLRLLIFLLECDLTVRVQALGW